jgi:hypothetical protein
MLNTPYQIALEFLSDGVDFSWTRLILVGGVCLLLVEGCTARGAGTAKSVELAVELSLFGVLAGTVTGAIDETTTVRSPNNANVEKPAV